MLSFLPRPVRAVLTLLTLIANTVFWCLLLYPLALVKALIPLTWLRAWCTRKMVQIAERWISVNSWGIELLHNIEWDIRGVEGLHADRSYLVSANHCSWVDIVVLQHVFNRRVPFLRFFLKHQLIYVPLLGLAWWALDFPFMRRYSKAYLAKHPEKRGKDLAATRRACARFSGSPISVLNFLEGTRFTVEKHKKQDSPFANLLLPKAGGVAFVLDAMGTQFDSLLDVTIIYPEGPVTLAGFLSGRLRRVVVDVKQVPIPRELLGGSYQDDELFRGQMQNWVRELWLEKDKLISAETKM